MCDLFLYPKERLTRAAVWPRGVEEDMRSHSLAAAAAISAAGLAAVWLYYRRRRLQDRAFAGPGSATQAADTCKPGAVCTATGAEGKISRAKKRANSSPCVQVVPPTLISSWQIEYSVHHPSRLLRNDIALVFRPDLQKAYENDPRGASAGVEFESYLASNLLALPTWQPSQFDLSEISYEINQERKGLLDNFDHWAKVFRPALGEYWSDCSCPMEGTARYGTPTTAIYNELEGLTTLLRYDAVPVGCCGIVLHPKWQRRAYPVTMFTLAPLDVVTRALQKSESARSHS